MHHVAERAGVSLKTVSRVINDEPNVAAATAARVTAAIAELGFRRNDLARSLRQGRSSATLGLVIEDVANPFYSAIAQAVERVARERGFMVIAGSCAEDPERERELVHALLRRRVDALVLVPAAADHGWLAGEDTPIVFLDRPPVGVEADAVLLDNAGGAHSAVAHLVAHGHRRIACVADPEELVTAAERIAGYRAALADAGIEPDPRLVRTSSRDPEHSQAIVAELLALPERVRPTALFTGNNRHTVGALRALRAQPGRDLALVGFDDFELADLLATPTTVVRHDSHRMGVEAARLAFARLDGDAAPPRRVVLPTELVLRGSGEVPPP
jgi:LacI family transcriptional regulator